MPTHVLDNATLWIGDGKSFDGHVVVDGRTIEAVEHGRYAGPLPVTDLAGLSLSPGMIDLMTLGGFGMSILRDDQIDLGRAYLKLGVTSLQVCMGTLQPDRLKQLAANTCRAQAYKGTDAARVLSLYLEGPFQEPRLTGGSLRELAQPPTPDNVSRVLEDCGGALRMINVSPGVEHDTDAIARFVAAGVTVTMAHSDAPADHVAACLEAGTSQLGHVWDNNSALIGDSGVQQPTIDHVALVDERVRFMHMLCDGTHVHTVMMKIVLRCRGLEAVCLVTDGNQRMGCEDGEFEWDDGRIMTKAKGVCRTPEGWLAGSATALPDMFRHFVKVTGTQPQQAIAAVTANPAAAIGLADQIGRLSPGLTADLIAWDDQLRVRRIWRAGEPCNDVSDFQEIYL